VLCYLLVRHRWTVEAAQRYLLQRRRRISSDIFRRPIVQQFIQARGLRDLRPAA